jgi:hypothetical protein
MDMKMAFHRVLPPAGLFVRKVRKTKACCFMLDNRTAERDTFELFKATPPYKIKLGNIVSFSCREKWRENPKREGFYSQVRSNLSFAEDKPAILAGFRSGFCRPLQQILLLDLIFLNH